MDFVSGPSGTRIATQSPFRADLPCRRRPTFSRAFGAPENPSSPVTTSAAPWALPCTNAASDNRSKRPSRFISPNPSGVGKFCGLRRAGCPPPRGGIHQPGATPWATGGSRFIPLSKGGIRWSTPRPRRRVPRIAPFQGAVRFWAPSSPGRCPGLTNGCAFGALIRPGNPWTADPRCGRPCLCRGAQRRSSTAPREFICRPSDHESKKIRVFDAPWICRDAAGLQRPNATARHNSALCDTGSALPASACPGSAPTGLDLSAQGHAPRDRPCPWHSALKGRNSVRSPTGRDEVVGLCRPRGRSERAPRKPRREGRRAASAGSNPSEHDFGAFHRPSHPNGARPLSKWPSAVHDADSVRGDFFAAPWGRGRPALRLALGDRRGPT